ncbi:hypothetical protein SESBI_32217 [Sesbania bispinosa]|nr:hypothetical protein SESBI_32217 [Sesbania bispinosa]
MGGGKDKHHDDDKGIFSHLAHGVAHAAHGYPPGAYPPPPGAYPPHQGYPPGMATLHKGVILLLVTPLPVILLQVILQLVILQLVIRVHLLHITPV